jgi:hypothetical protein
MPSPRKTLSVLSLVGIAIAVPALAQQPASSYPVPCESSKVSKGDVDRAHTVFLSGKGFLDESNYDKAISYFKDAYTIDCSVHGILPIIATAYERKGDKAEAIRALEEYVKRAPTASDREIIERRIKNLRDQLVQEKPTAVAPATGSAPPTATAAPTASATVAPGPEATAAPAPTVTSAPPAEGQHSLTPWIAVGAGGAAVVTGIILFGVGVGDVSNAESQCPTHKNCTSAAADQGNTGRTLETVGVIAGAVGIAGIAGGIVWHFIEPVPALVTTPAAPPAARVSPVLAPGFAGLSVGGSF